MKGLLIRTSMSVAVASVLALGIASAADEERRHMELVGTTGISPERFTADVDVDTDRNVAYVGAFEDEGVAVVDISDRSNPTVVRVLGTEYAGPGLPSNSIDVKVRGNLLAVANEPLEDGAFGGVTLYDLTDPFNPAQRGQFATGSTHNVFIDPGFPARPYVYLANSDFAGTDDTVVIVKVSKNLNKLTSVGELLPSDEDVGCQVTECGIFGGPFASAHDLFVQQHPLTGNFLAYVAYWDAGLRIYDVTKPRKTVEIGVFDVDPPPSDPEELPCCIHYAQPTPSGQWVLIEEEVGVRDTGDVRILDASGCDGGNSCAPSLVSSWQPPQGQARQAPSYSALL